MLGTPFALEKGEHVISVVEGSAQILRDVQLETAIINMFTKCGSPDRALQHYDKMQNSGIVVRASFPFICVKFTILGE